MIGTIRKHSAWLWVVIIAVTIFSFIYWGSSRYDPSRSGKAYYGSIDGEPVSRDELTDAQHEVSLRYFLTYGTWPDNDTRKTGFDLQRETYQWLFLVRKLKEYDIHVDSASVYQAGSEILQGFARENSAIRDMLVQQHTEDLERFIRHDLGRQQLFSIIGLSSQLVTPQEAQSLYEHDHQEISAEAVFFSGSNYLARVPAAPADAVARFYTNEMAAYRVPERMQVSYVAFDITNLLARVESAFTNLTEAVDTTYLRLGTNTARFGKTPEAAKVKLREELIRQQALHDAGRKADEFANDLLGLEPPQAGNLAALAKTNGLTVKTTAPFDEDHGPAEFDGGPSFAKVAFSLTPEKPIAEQTLIGDNAVYVIALDKKFPSEIPPLDRIRDQVTADYKYSQAVLLARNAGENLVQAATNGFAQGKTFAAICEGAGARPIALPPFSISTRELPAVEDQVNLNQFKQLAFSTPPGKVNGFTPPYETSSATYVVVYVQKRLPIDEAKMKVELPGFLNLVRRSRQMEAVNAWFTREASTSLRDTPLAQAKPAPAEPVEQ